MPDDPSSSLNPAIQAQLSAQAALAARSDHIQRNMQDIPPAYRLAMPVTSDPAQLAAAEKQLRQQYQSDRDQFDGNGNGAKTQAAPDTRSPQQMIADGMRGKDLNGGREPDPSPKLPGVNPLPGFSSKNDIRQAS